VGRRRRPDETPAEKRGRNNKAFGKAQERRIAGLVDSWWRNPDSGTKVADVESPTHAFEVKATRDHAPVWLQDATVQREAAEAETGKPGRIIFSHIDKRTGLRVDWIMEPLPTWIARNEGG
jgi:hypothetical protein